MKGLSRNYWMPVIVGVLMVIAVGVLEWQAFRAFRQAREEHERRMAAGLFDMIEGTLDAFTTNGILHREGAETALAAMLKTLPVRFVIVENKGERALSAGQAPGEVSLPPGTDEVKFDTYTLYRRQFNPEDVVYIGVNGPPDGEHVPRPVRAMIITTVILLLFVGATVTAWIMTIRSGILAEQLQAERARRAHLEEMSLAAAGLAHETKNPLGIIMGLAQRISSDAKVPPESRTTAENIVDEVDRAAARLGSFLSFARQREPEERPLDLHKAVSRVFEIMHPDFDLAGVQLAAECSDIVVLADHELLSQILVNLLLNSLRASARGQTVSVRAKAKGNQAQMEVEDQGAGIAPELLPDIFKPYVSGRPEGHGLGLALVKRFVEQHGWTIQVESQLGTGTRVTISGMAIVKAAQDNTWT